MAFKHRPDKIKYVSNIKTLDETHKKFASGFENKRTNLENYKAKIKELQQELNLLEATGDFSLSNYYHDGLSSDLSVGNQNIIHKRANIRSEIDRLNYEIKNIESGNDELEYYARTDKYLFDYYDILDNNQEEDTDEISNMSDDNESDQRYSSGPTKLHDVGETDVNTEKNKEREQDELDKLSKLCHKGKKEKKPTKKRIRNTDTTQQKSEKVNILSFFGIHNFSFSEQPAPRGGHRNIIDFGEKKQNRVSVSEVQEKLSNKNRKTANRASLFEEYMFAIDREYASNRIRPNLIRYCEDCNIEKVLIQADGMYVCKNCGQVEHVIVESEIPNHKDAMNEKPRYPYRRINHLIECLNQFQAKESTVIPDDVITNIRRELDKRMLKINELKSMKYPNLLSLFRTILRQLRYTTYYEHVPSIICKITNLSPPILSRETEEKVKKYFLEAQESFEKFRPASRSNFLNYSNTLRRIFQLLGMHEYAECFPLLKSKEKLRLQDQIWKEICQDRGWKYYPSSQS